MYHENAPVLKRGRTPAWTAAVLAFSLFLFLFDIGRCPVLAAAFGFAPATAVVLACFLYTSKKKRFFVTCDSVSWLR